MIGRREFITLIGGAAAWPIAARGQQTKVWRVGYLALGIRLSPGWTPFDAFLKKLSDLGYVEGTTLVVEVRTADQQYQRLPALAQELVALRPDVIVANATPAIAAAHGATSTIPIVMCPATDPIGSGFVKSYTHPGGNITGVANMYEDVMGKLVEILHSLVPAAKKVAVLMSPNPTHPAQYQVAQAALQALDVAAVPILASTPADLPESFRKITDAACGALLVLADPMRPTIVPLAASAGIPTLYQIRQFVEIGGLASYGANIYELFKMAAVYVDKIFRGANPADLPVEQPTIFELVINLKTAKALGLEISPMILARSDEVIE